MDAHKQALKQLYTSVYSQCYSPCGKYLAACNNFGKIALFNISSALSLDKSDESWNPVFSFLAHNGPVFSLTSNDKDLISAGTGEIKAWHWVDILSRTAKAAWSLSVPVESRFESFEINSLVIDKKDGNSYLYAGCGDNNVYMWDLEAGTLLNTLKGHTDYIHCVSLRSSCNECLSASEDGSVRIWDIRIPNEAVHVIEPHKNEKCARPHFGKWIGCVALDSGEDWMICGGGPEISLWYLRSLSPTTIFADKNTRHQFLMFNEDTIISGGNAPVISHWNISGSLKSQVPCTSNNVYNVCINNTNDSNRVLSVGGNSSKIDIFTNFGYKAFSLNFL